MSQLLKGRDFKMLKTRKKKGKEEEKKEKQIVVEGQESEVEESISLLTSKEAKSAVEKVITEVDTTVKEAAKESLRGLKLLEEGRCPECGKKTKRFLFTSVCPYCGWSSFISPQQKGRMIVHLKDGSTLGCDSTFDTETGDILCITDEVVRQRVPKENVNYTEFAWTEEEIAERRLQREREATGICDWCGDTTPKSGMIETYVAFGTYQERYFFCSQRCYLAFQKQYPVRIHRDCYHRPCEDCNECIKKYSDTSKKKVIGIEELVREA